MFGERVGVMRALGFFCIGVLRWFCSLVWWLKMLILFLFFSLLSFVLFGVYFSRLWAYLRMIWPNKTSAVFCAFIVRRFLSSLLGYKVSIEPARLHTW